MENVLRLAFGELTERMNKATPAVCIQADKATYQPSDSLPKF